MLTFGDIAGGLTVPSKLRIMQCQACKKKNNKLEFLIPWWDLHVGISINQFLSIFAISNSDFRLVVVCLLSAFPVSKLDFATSRFSVSSFSGVEHFPGCFLKVKVKNWMPHNLLIHMFFLNILLSRKKRLAWLQQLLFYLEGSLLNLPRLWNHWI